MARLKPSRLKLISSLAIVALGSLVFGSFSPDAVGIATQVTIEPKFHGQVIAQPPCQADREVLLKKKRRKGKRPRNKILGTTRSDRNGNWSIPSDRMFGRRYFAVAKEVTTSGSTGYGYFGYGSQLCEKGKSEKIHLADRPGRRPRRRR